MYYKLVYQVTLPNGAAYVDEVEVEAQSLTAARHMAVETWPGAQLELLSSSASRLPQTRQGRFSRLLLGWR
jgi:hypothetical protein